MDEDTNNAPGASSSSPTTRSLPRPSSLARKSLSTGTRAQRSRAQDDDDDDRSRRSSHNLSPSSKSRAIYASWERGSDIRGDVLASAGLFMDDDCENDDNGREEEEERYDRQYTWRLKDGVVRPVPAFYPALDPRSTREVSRPSGGRANPGEVISRRISDACRRLSVRGTWDDLRSSATLLTMERVEMEITVYLGDADPTALLVEIVRRKGCTVAFHNYRRRLLDAAGGMFDHVSHMKTDGLDKPAGRDRYNQPRASLVRPRLATPSPSGGSARGGGGGIVRPSLARPGLSRPSISRGTACDAVARPDNNNKEEDAVGERAMEALNTAASLLRKDRADARRLGMESLVLLTDPLKAGAETSRIASRVVLLGSPSAPEGGTADDDNGTMIDTLFDESSCGVGIRETILETITGTTNGREEKEERTRLDADAPRHHGGLEGIEGELAEGLFGLCLTALSNALHAMDDPAVVRRFVDETDSVLGRDDGIVSSLLRIVDRAGSTDPHKACLAARCLGIVLGGYGNEGRSRARGDMNAGRIVGAALEAGVRGHAALAEASRAAAAALATDDGGSGTKEKEEERREGHMVPVGVRGNSRGPKWRTSGGHSGPFSSLSKRMRKGSTSR